MHFLDVEGIYVLLDLIETCDYTVKRLACSCMCTILENAKAFQYFVEWNSKKTNMNASQLLIDLYKNEDKRFGVITTDGLITNKERPLLPLQSFLKQKFGDSILQANATLAQPLTISKQNSRSDIENVGGEYEMDSVMNPEEAAIAQQQQASNENSQMTSGSKASRVLRMALDAAQRLNEKEKDSESYLNSMLNELVKSYDIRSCVFATFFRVGFDLHELSAFEKQYMELIQLFPYLKNGEIWKDIKQEMDDVDCKPTGDDKHWMDSAIEMSSEQAEKAHHKQKKIL